MMRRSVPFLSAGIALGAGLIFAVAASSDNETVENKAARGQGGHADENHRHGDHSHHEVISIPPGAEAPTVDISISRDAVAGWNLHVTTTYFRFAPEHASSAHIAGEGHAHVYVNGRKIARLYGPWMHIAKLPSGRSEISVTLNSNDHRDISVESEIIRASDIIDVE